jgi:hypothetical protein
MELEESKRALLRKSSLYKEQLEGEAKLFSDRAEKIITNALVIGGALALSYLVVSQFSKSKRKSKSKAKSIRLVSEPPAEAEYAPAQESGISRMATEIGTAMASQATAFLLSIAREKLMEYLQSKVEKKTPNNEHP